MNAIEAINKALPIFLQYGSLEDEDLVDIFIKKGFPPDTARKVIVFMPLAFGRVIVNELRVETSDEFEIADLVENRVRIKHRRKLKDVEIYRESFKVASAMSDEEKNDETFLVVAYRSAEVNAVHQLRSQSGGLGGGVLTSMLTMWEIDEEPPYEITESIKAENIKTTQPKNWWEFWK